MMLTQSHNIQITISTASMTKFIIVALIALSFTVVTESLFHTGKPLFLLVPGIIAGMLLTSRRTQCADSIQNIM